MNQEILASELRSAREFFERSTRVLSEEDSTFAPTEESMTVAHQIAHVAQTVDWFFEGAFRPEGFSMDFEAMAKEIRAVESVGAARQWLDRAFTAAEEKVRSTSMEEWSQPLPEGPVMGGLPRFAIVGSITDHTAHHRGALTVYSRLRGKTPPMPYMEM